MKKTKIYDYYAFGNNYALSRMKQYEGSNRKSTIDDLEKFINSLLELDVPVTSKIAENLSELLSDMETKEDNNISKSEAVEIKSEFEKIDPALDAELKMKEALILTEKRFPLSYLTSTPNKLLGENIFSLLNETSQKDFSFACMQIALTQPTASAFHLMRALEQEVKNLYFSFKKTKRLEKPMWGPMLKELREKQSPKPSAKSLDLLDSIRIHFRNPTQHPDAFYTLDEAQDLLSQTITAINMIHKEIQGKK